jgi:hypothetical protein
MKGDRYLTNIQGQNDLTLSRYSSHALIIDAAIEKQKIKL